VTWDICFLERATFGEERVQEERVQEERVQEERVQSFKKERTG
jgi:hypothetical protein